MKSEPVLSSKKLLAFLLEIAIIFIGITLSFGFDQWKEKEKNKEKELFYLRLIRDDLADDIHEMEQDLNLFKETGKALKFYVRYNAQQNPFPDSLGYYYQYLYRAGQVFPNSSGFDALKSTSSLDIIANKDILRQLLQLYQNDLQKLSYWNANRKEMQQLLILPYFSKRVRFLQRTNNMVSLYEEAEFHNILHTLLNYNQLLTATYQSTLASCHQLQENIQKELAARGEGSQENQH